MPESFDLSDAVVADRRRLVDLVRNPREQLDLELKGWLDLRTPDGKADLAQALLALANHGGGWVLVGFEDSGQPAPNEPADLSAYSQDLVNGVVKKFAEPAFHCDVQIIEDGGRSHPVISVPGGHRVPIRAKCSGPEQRHVRQDTYYVRRPGPESAPVGSGREWDELISRCMLAARSELIQRISSMLNPGTAKVEQSTLDLLKVWESASLERFNELVSTELANEHPSRYALGHWTFSYGLELPASLTLDSLFDALRRAEGRETGWPAWMVMDSEDLRPYPHEGTIECWLHRSDRDAAHSDFWRASPDGRFFLLRGYQEDSGEDQKAQVGPGEAIERGLQVWRIGECLLHLSRMAQAVGAPGAHGQVLVHWTGLEGRRLGEFFRGWREGADTPPARQRAARAELSVVADQIPEQLTDLVHRATKPLYEAFSFRGVSREQVAAELDRMLKRGR